VAIPTQRDPAATAQALTAWLADRLPTGAEPVLGNLVVPQATGHSNETLVFDATWRGADPAIPDERRPVSLVARIRPTGYAVFPEYDLSVQYRCMEILGRLSDVPVPAVRWLEERADVLGQPFYVMDKVEGVVPGDVPPFSAEGWLKDAAPADQARLWRSSIAVLARLHALDWEAAGFGFLAGPGASGGDFDAQLAYQRRFLEWMARGRPQPTLEAALEWVERHRPASADDVVLNWGDARLANVMYRDFEPVAVLDWEMACLGPPEVDLGWWWYMTRYMSEGVGRSHLPGFPDRDGTAALYEQLSGRRVRDLDYYEVYAALRFGIILSRIADMYRDLGLFPPDADVVTNNGAVRMLAALLDLPSPGPPGLMG
jgi:aminoglycoside phosphotransferase (APT) family kinase protein